MRDYNAMLLPIVNCLQRFRRHCRGAALIEFALIAPLLIALLLGGVEFGRYILITQKVEKSGYTLGNVLTQYTAAQIADESSFDAVFNQYGTIMTPYGDGTTQRVVFTSVTKDPADHKVKIDWQKTGGGTLSNEQTVSVVDALAASSISTNNPTAHQVATFSDNTNVTNLLQPGTSNGMADGENMIVTEVFYQYKPMSANLLQSFGITVTPATLVRRTFMRPRQGDLNQTSCASGTASWPPGCTGNYDALNSGDKTTVNNIASGYSGSETATCSGSTVIFSGATCNAGSSDGVCGPANGGNFASASAANSAGLCSSGAAAPSSVTGNGPWSWTCSGTGSGATANCATNGCSSGQSMQWVKISQSDYKCSGPPSYFKAGPNPCTGSCDPQSSPKECKWAMSCELQNIYMCQCGTSQSSAQCGGADGGVVTYQVPPTDNLCANGATPSAVTDNNTGSYTWTCSGGSGAPASCHADYCNLNILTLSPTMAPGCGAKTGGSCFCCDRAPHDGCFMPKTCTIEVVWEPTKPASGGQIQCPNGSLCQNPAANWPMTKCFDE